VIVPLCNDDGLPEIDRLDEWPVICDRCGQRSQLRECRTWVIGQRKPGLTYCPSCVAELAARLIGSLSRWQRLYMRLVRILGRPMRVARRWGR
jgi:hypothetical protein